jgi:hypothetical protein
MTTLASTQGTIIEAATGYQETGVYERHGKRFIYTMTEKGLFCFCIGREHVDIDLAWQQGYREEIARGYYTL